MKAKLPLFLAALTLGVTVTAMAGPDLQTLDLRRQIAESQRATRVATVDSGPTHYVASPSGKGGVVMKSDGTTGIAVFKSKKMKSAECSDAACCSMNKGHKH
ncbi:hypothetical protein [Roseimicrobium sp. ORNL1]|uniref:hypothetical protein n=1 Tax=Roseimicrobium sp. ORNL1 TaxID=2711231 RepID=UPI0013E10DE6|nr:hypothetical protein [Roseimicrobium sp. ORNL1]QIF01779.1 hypothetical protein G5S37_09655 [Roseimicrobium sp. ORNL1]